MPGEVVERFQARGLKIIDSGLQRTNRLHLASLRIKSSERTFTRYSGTTLFIRKMLLRLVKKQHAMLALFWLVFRGIS
jgi:hypothetical protein